jgi:D-threo-aldose 1-dehydrogenase
MDSLYKEGVGIINSAVFHGGFLTGGDKFDYQDVDPESNKGKSLYEWRKCFLQLCQKFEIRPEEACIHFGISHPAIASLALNTSKPDKMLTNVEILTKEIKKEFWKALKDQGVIDKKYKYL